MKGLGYACALMLAAVFVRAGAAKLARPTETAAGFRALGVPKPGWLARLVPLVEFALAAVLGAFPRIGGLASLLVLGVFTRFLARALAGGVVAPCNCFGTIRTDPISIVDVVRNLLLGGLAAIALTSPRPSTPGPPALVAATVIAASALVVIGLIRRSVADPDRGA